MAGSSKGSLFDGQYRAVTPEIERLTVLIRDTFLSERRLYLPTAPTAASKASYDHFLQTAFLVQKLGVDPVEFTTRQVRVLAESGTIFPQGLHSLKVWHRQPAKESITRSSLADYTAQYGIFKGLQRSFTPQQAIMDPVNQFSPLFRACVAMRLGLHYFAAQYSEQAKRELHLNPIARQIFPDEVVRL